MKSIKLIFHQMKRFIRTNRSFFLFYIILQIIAILIIFFSAATIQSVFIKEKEISLFSRYFEIDLRIESETETVKEIIGYKEDNGKKIPVYEECPKIDYSYALPTDEMLYKANKLFSGNELDVRYGAVTGIYNDLKIRYSLITTDRSTTGNTVRIRENLFPDTEIGDEIEIGGKLYTVSEIVALNVDDVTILSGETLSEHHKKFSVCRADGCLSCRTTGTHE